MESQYPPFLVEPDPIDPDAEEPLEVPDYYDVIQAEWLRSDEEDEEEKDLHQPVTPVDPPRE